MKPHLIMIYNDRFILNILNIFLFFPTLSCLKNTGPFELILIAIATISIGKDKRIITNNEQNMSKALLKNEYIGFFFIR